MSFQRANLCGVGAGVRRMDGVEIPVGIMNERIGDRRAQLTAGGYPQADRLGRACANTDLLKSGLWLLRLRCP